MFLQILLILLAFFVGIQFLYYVFILGRFSFSKKTTTTAKKIPISVIVCAKNEAENIKKYFPLLISQNHPDYEIILIDDASSDETLDLFEKYEQQYSNIKLVKVQNNETFWGNKKYALTLGIKVAKNEHLLFIDADCYPNSKNWITQMASQFTSKKAIVLGYGGYEKIKNSFLNKVIRFETLVTATQYFGWAKTGNPYMGVGRNLAYTKKTFFDAGGFIEHMKIRSGDDDLFINQVGTKSNTTICFTPESFTYSEPKKTFNEWFNQKRRHVSTAKLYKPFDRLQLGLFYISQLAFILLSIILLAFQHQWIIVTSIIVFRYLFTWISLGYAAGKLKEKDVMYWYPIIEFFLIFTQLNVFFTNIFSKPVHWK
ncbi:glycosyl transferase family 2 [Flavobacterium sp. 316]|uniref:Glycosyltransferase n=1 Tax=Flavobacterium sediminilitoris TaxID=2024526 RepID=A0ABY4HHE3_9FLAO|nr:MULTISPECIES: glycosyltransferase [Flavobacterium]KIX22004.1 glycosyl transferase family 2 [Flavobacterium sp. 316]UOX32264.1 glycosyltransferase [Flavobacterium sediminilitoris]